MREAKARDEFSTWYRVSAFADGITPIEARAAGDTTVEVRLDGVRTVRVSRRSAGNCYYRDFEEAKGHLVRRFEAAVEGAGRNLQHLRTKLAAARALEPPAAAGEEAS